MNLAETAYPEEENLVIPLNTAVPGRVRLKVRGLYQTPPMKRLIEARLRGQPGINNVEASSLTGNVLVLFSPEQTATRIIEDLEHLVADTAVHPELFDEPAANDDPHQQAGYAGVIVPARAGEAWHARETDAVLDELSTRTQGLSRREAERRLAEHGPNRLPEPPRTSSAEIFFRQFKSLPVGLLAASAIVSVLTGGIAEAVVIAGVVMANAGIGYTTEKETEKTLNALGEEIEQAALVVRDGEMVEVPTDQVVPGDILMLSQGNQVAADARLIVANNLTVDESALTGESMPVRKTNERIDQPNPPLGDRFNMVYMGTTVTGGSGLAVVIATGRETEIGLIQHLVGHTRTPPTPIQRQLDQLGTQLVLMCGMACGFVFIAGLLRGQGLLQMFKAAISLAVAAVPEGLPTVATTTLVLGIRRMRRQKVLIRQLQAVETLGAIQVLCLDKTGTLTENRMSVRAVVLSNRHLVHQAGRLEAAGHRVDLYQNDELLRLLHAIVLCNETTVDGNEGEQVLNGSSTENALIELAIESGVNVVQLRDRYPLLKMEYRSEGRNYMASLHSTHDGRRLLAVKGSPEQVLAMCHYAIQDGQRVELTEAMRQRIQRANGQMAADALRVLGVAYRETDENTENLDQLLEQDNLYWLGLVGMADPIRKGVADLIQVLHQAGIKTVMLTGDQEATACAIARELHLSGNGHLESMDATALENVPDERLPQIARQVNVFARVSPAIKLKIVQTLQQSGEVIAMTGDGINDSPALKAANVGIAMGASGTRVAHRVADVVLEDDELQTLVMAIGSGRTIYNNIRKSVHFLVSTNISEITVMLASVGLGLGQPLTAMQLLWINLLTDVFPGLALSAEPAEPDVLSRPPREANAPIIHPADYKRYASESLSISLGTLASYGYGLLRYGQGARASTLAFNTLLSAQLLHAYSCRSETHSVFSKDRLPPNRPLDLAIGAMSGLQLVAAFIPGLRGLLGTTPMGPIDFLVAGAGSIAPFIFNEMTKGNRAAGQQDMKKQESTADRKAAGSLQENAAQRGGTLDTE